MNNTPAINTISNAAISALHVPRMITSAVKRQRLDMIEMIPPSVRRSGNRGINNFIKDRDGSHIISVENGGATTNDNMMWEWYKWNRARGKRNMTMYERIRAHFHNHKDATIISAPTLVRTAGKSIVTAALFEGIISTIETGCHVYHGNLNAADAACAVVDNTYKAAKSSVIALPIMAGMFFLPFTGAALTTVTVIGGAATAYHQGSRVITAATNGKTRAIKKKTKKAVNRLACNIRREIKALAAGAKAFMKAPKSL